MRGTIIQNTTHSEWGEFIITQKTEFDGEYWYDIRGLDGQGSRVLFPEEMKKEWIVIQSPKVSQ